MLVTTINGTGAVIEAVYVVVFIIYAPRKVRTKMLGLFALVVAAFAAVALSSLLILHGETRKLFCGFAAGVFSICMYASPLSVMVNNLYVPFFFFPFFLFIFYYMRLWVKLY